MTCARNSAVMRIDWWVGPPQLSLDGNQTRMNFSRPNICEPQVCRSFTAVPHTRALSRALACRDIRSLTTSPPSCPLCGLLGIDENALLLGGLRRLGGFSPDGKTVATGSADKAAKIWDSEAGTLLLTFEMYDRPVQTITFNPDGSRLAIGHPWWGGVKVIDAKSGAILFRASTYKLTSVDFDATGKRLLTSEAEEGGCWTRIRDTATGEELLFLRGHASHISSARFGPGDRTILTASNDGTARVWDAETGEALAAFSGHRGSVECAAFSSDGRQVVTGATDTTAKIWDTELERPSPRVIRPGAGAFCKVHSAAMSPDGQHIVCSAKPYRPFAGSVVPFQRRSSSTRRG